MHLTRMKSTSYPQSYYFLRSAFAREGVAGDCNAVKNWLREQNEKVHVAVRKIPFDQLERWEYDSAVGSIRHESGKFFSIDGIQVKTNWGPRAQWQQPIINQPEIGYLGFITRMFNGVLHFLAQAKIEPGNVNYVQLSPTLQATRSNYTQIHQGKKPLYLEYFQKATPEQIVLDQLQSEQGARFLKKRNRNIIIQVDDELPVYDNFIWLTLGQLKELMQSDNLVNMDTRTVISGIPFGSYDASTLDFFEFLQESKNTHRFGAKFLKSALTDGHARHSIEEIITFLTVLKSTFDLELSKIDLRKLDQWIFGPTEIYHEEKKYFRVIAVDVEIGNREVVRWTQPMVEPAQEGLCAFVCKEIEGVLHFAVQAKLECGNYDIVEFAPTVQCLTGNYQSVKDGNLPFLDYVLNAKSEQVVLDVHQSEEGGRFFREQNRNMIIMAGDDLSDALPDKYIWMTLNQMYTFLKFNNYLNIQARSLISAIQFV